MTRRESTITLLVVAASLAALIAWPASAQTLRIEVHPIQTVTLSTEQFLTGAKDGKAATIAGELRLPRLGADRLPAVVLVHGSGGVGANVDRWSEEVRSIGAATFVVDSFTGRGITSTGSDQSQLSSLAMIGDAYRALELLAKHPRVDPTRIAVMGFSKGAVPALYASLMRFQRLYGPAGVEFAAYLPFYAPCYFKYLDDEAVSNRPIRLFHGIADDYVPIGPCRQYVARLQRGGKNVQLYEYPDAHHAFDAFTLKAPLHLPQAQTARRCFYEERTPGRVVNSQTGRPFDLDDPCIERGATVAYNETAHAQAVKTVKEVLAATFRLQP